MAGDLADLELRDGLTYGAGVGRGLGAEGSVSVIASSSGSTRVIDGVEPPISVGAAVGVRGSPGRSVLAGVRVGLTESASDVSAFLGWRIGIR